MDTWYHIDRVAEGWVREKESRWTIQSGPEGRRAGKTDKTSLRGKDDGKRGIEIKTVENVLKKRDERENEKKERDEDSFDNTSPKLLRVWLPVCGY